MPVPGFAAILYLVLNGSLWSQDARIRGTVTGFVFDPPTRSIRPILGLPGAATLGDAIARDLAVAVVAPNGKYALAVQNGQVVLFSRLDVDLASKVLEGVIDSPNSIVWSPDSTAAVLYSATRSLLQRIDRLDISPRIDQLLDLSSLGGAISKVAVDRAAQRVAVGIQNSPRSGLYLISPGNDPVLMADMQDPGALFFSKDGDLYAAGLESHRILRLQSVSASPAVLPFLDQQDGITDAAGIALSGDGKLFYVVSGGSQRLRIYDTANRSLVAEEPLEATPTFLEPLNGAGLLIMNTRVKMQDPILLLDTRSNLVYFVPPAPLPQTDDGASRPSGQN